MMGAATVPALGAESLREALFEGRPILNVRYRYETVQEDGFVLDAHASTLRTRIGYETQTFYDTYVLLEGENVSSIGAEEFNSTVNGKTQFPVVADPDATELNQGFIHYAGIPSTQLRLGRQRIVLDNQRFVGPSDFRQNEQTFDAVSITNDFIRNVQARYVYIGKVHRIFGDESPIGEFDSDTHLLNVAYDGSSLGKLIGYTYLIDLEEAPRLSSATYGARFSGSHKFRFNRDFGLVYAAEFAHQHDYADNPVGFSVNYFLLEPGISYRKFVAKFGYESLGGDGTSSFQTPLASLHAFNGVVDKFLVTPPDGLEDIYVKVAFNSGRVGPFESVALSGNYHRFSAEDSSADFGSEWGLKLALKLNRFWLFSAEYAKYNADGFATDTGKTWITARFTF